jgi:mercuric ion transport protein
MARDESIGRAPADARAMAALGAAPVAGAAVAVAGGIVAAIASASCCVVPFLLFTLGVSGAWIGNLTALARYQPYFVALAATCLAAGFWLIYRQRPVACAEGSFCACPRSRRLAKSGLWSATILAVVAAAFPYLARRLLDL